MVESHEGCNALLYDGAWPAIDPRCAVEDFLFVTGMERGERTGGERSPTWHMRFGSAGVVDSDTAPLLSALALGPCSVDDLVNRTGRPVREVAASLALMEIQGVVARGGPGLFIRAP
jgi:predicted Rossmann fold nucleotide-binding protein DprA/Smf involved in DNA uptake